MAEPIPVPVGGDQSQGPTLNGVCWGLTTVSIFCVVARLYVRTKVVRSFGSDDVVTIVSILLQIISTAIISASIVVGVGRHEYYLTPDQLMRAVKLNSITQPFSIMAFCVPKLAVAILLIRIMPPARRSAWFLLTSTTTLIILSALCAIFLFIQCSPPKTLWEPLTPGAHCWNPSILTNYTIFVGSASAFVDLSLALFPITIFWSLQIELTRKITICCLMGLGVFAAVCAIIKTTKLYELGEHSDYTWATSSLILWTNIESNVVIICACLPTIQPLISRLSGQDTYRSSSGSSSRPRTKNRREFQSLKSDALALHPARRADENG